MPVISLRMKYLPHKNTDDPDYEPLLIDGPVNDENKAPEINKEVLDQRKRRTRKKVAEPKDWEKNKNKALRMVGTEYLGYQKTKDGNGKQTIKLENNRDIYKNYYDRNAVIKKEFGEKDNKVIQEGKTWQPAKVTKKLDTPRSYIVQKQNGKLLRRNSSHIRPSRGHHQLRKDLADFDHTHTTEDNVRDKDIVEPIKTLMSSTTNN
ncbi:unnamed protein product [Ceutorhynchus assimilis]|uniref:Uncharacterized protein n=1 Tax=Ceutorhynchus assimilis TaxID=467358 RepID=A0A9N9MBL6_9CUCU|nr:unnamed protein product [Ceutorhynchus assimilis]